MDWPIVITYRGLVSAHRLKIIEDLFKYIEDQKRAIVHAGMIR